jgi:hypothetical protein
VLLLFAETTDGRQLQSVELLDRLRYRNEARGRWSGAGRLWPQTSSSVRRRRCGTTGNAAHGSKSTGTNFDGVTATVRKLLSAYPAAPAVTPSTTPATVQRARHAPPKPHSTLQTARAMQVAAAKPSAMVEALAPSCLPSIMSMTNSTARNRANPNPPKQSWLPLSCGSPLAARRRRYGHRQRLPERPPHQGSWLRRSCLSWPPGRFIGEPFSQSEHAPLEHLGPGSDRL